jgi:hypothetical protein
MAFIVQGKSGLPGEGSFRAEKATRKDAVKAAAHLIGQGVEVTITDEGGRVFEVHEFSKFFAGDY